MPTSEHIRAALRAHDGDYHLLSRELGVPAGLAYLIATGRPADGSGGQYGRGQALVNPREVNPTGRADVLAWIKLRALSDSSPRGQR